MTYPPGGYGGPPPGWGDPPPGPYGPYGPPGPPTVDHPQGIVVLILGIFSIMACQLCGPFAWVMGRRALAEIDAQPGRYGNRGLVQAGYICGIVGSALLGVYLIGGVLYVVFFAAVLAGSA